MPESRLIRITVDEDLYQVLRTFATERGMTVPQVGAQLIQEHVHATHCNSVELGPATSDHRSIIQSEPFEWLLDAPDLYDDTCGEPI